MIISMRKFLKKNAQEGMGIFLVVIILIGLVGLPSFFKTGEDGDIWVVRVNDASIGYKAFIREVFTYREFLASIRSMYGQFAQYLLSSMGMSDNPERAATDKLTQQLLLNQYATKLKIYTHSQYVMNKLKERKFLGDFVSQSSFNADGTINTNQLRRELAHYGMTVSEFDDMVRDASQRAFLFDLYKTVFYVPQFDTNFQKLMMNAVRDVIISTISHESVLKEVKKTELTKEEIENYFAIQNKIAHRYWIPEKRDGTLWEFKKQLFPIKISDEEIGEYYEDQKSKKYVKTQPRVSVKEITSDLLIKKFPGDVLQNVAQNSEKYEQLWHAVPPFARGTHDEAFERAAFTLKNVGDISSVIQKEDGTSCVIRLVQLFPREYKLLSEVKELIVGELQLQKFKKKFVSEGRNAIDRGTVEEFLRQKGVVRLLLSEKGIDDAEGPKERGTKELFEMQNEGDYDIFVSGDSGYLIRFDRKVQGYEPPLDSIIDVVHGDIYEERAQTRVAELVSQINKMSFENASIFEEKMKDFGATIEFRGEINSANEVERKKIENYSLSSADIQNMELPLRARSFLRDAQAVTVFVRSISPSVASEEVSTTKQGQHEGQKEGRSLMFNALVAHLYRDATIEINHSVVMATQDAY